jgi:hypothetical protein
MMIRPNNPGIVYSPYTWQVTEAFAKTINAGAYLKTTFSGQYCVLNFNLEGIAEPVAQISYRIDGFGPWNTVSISPSVKLSIPAETLGYQRHYAEVVVKATTESQPRWQPQNTAVQLTGLSLDKNGSVAAPEVSDEKILFFGDSITEGIKTVSAKAVVDTDQNDALQSWAYLVGQSLGAEFGLVGFGGTGIVRPAGQGGVPALPITYNQLWDGQARNLTPEPKLIVINEGTNDPFDIAPACTQMLNLLLKACPNAKIAVIQPFNGNNSDSWKTAVQACDAPSRVQFIETAGFMPPNSSADNVHPYGWINISRIAPKIAPALRKMLQSTP